jgi:hypothetical protein
MLVRLNHFTNPTNADYMIASGVIMTTESNIGCRPEDALRHGLHPVGEHVGPDVVWLTDLDTAAQTGVLGGPARKGGVKVTVEVPDAEVHPWSEWAFDHGIHPTWYESLGRHNRPDRWWVVERPIPHTEWVEITADPPSDVLRNAPCPCGSGKKFKQCHSDRRMVLWMPEDGIDVTITPAEIHRLKQTLVDINGVVHVRDADGVARPVAD